MLDNYKKGRTVCKLCYNHVLAYYKNIFCSNSSSKESIGTQTDFTNNHDSSNEQDSSIKQVRSTKRNISNRQNCSNKQDNSSICLINVNPNLLCDK